MISYHNRAKGPTNNPYGFVPYNYKSVAELWNIMGAYTWSPTIFKDNYRKRSNFLFADVVGFDFDEGYTIEQCLADFEGFQIMIGTTKSHQLRKNDKPPCDRFRIVLPLERRVTDAAEFEHTVKWAAKIIEHSDKNCHEPARQFYPCKDFVCFHKGDAIPIQPAPPPEVIKRAAEIAEYRQQNEPIPAHVENFLDRGIPFGGSRNKSLYVSGLYLISKGFTLHQIEQRLRSAPFDRSEFHEREFISCLNSVARKIPKN